MRISIVALCLFVSTLSGGRVWAASNAVAGDDNCVIVTTSTSKMGEIKTHSNSFKFKTKKECMKMKNVVSVNFRPHTVKSVSSTVEWTGKEVIRPKHRRKKRKHSGLVR